MLNSFISCASFLPAGIFAYFIPSMKKTFNHEIYHKQLVTNGEEVINFFPQAGIFQSCHIPVEFCFRD